MGTFSSLWHLNFLITSLKLSFGVLLADPLLVLFFSLVTLHIILWVISSTPSLCLPFCWSVTWKAMSSAQLSPLSSSLVYCAANWIAPYGFPQHLSLTAYKLYFLSVPCISVSGIITSARLPKPESCHSRLFILQHAVRNHVRWLGGSVSWVSPSSLCCPWIPVGAFRLAFLAIVLYHSHPPNLSCTL